MATGPENFLKRLYRELENYNLPPFKIVNPSPDHLKLLKKETLIIGRLDGAIYYKITSENLYNLIRQRRVGVSKFFIFLKFLPNSLTLPLNKGINSYLNRFSKILQKKSNAIVFQSKLSKDMQEKFVGSWWKKKRNIIIPNGVPTDIFTPNGDSVSLEGSPKLAITASFRLHKRLQDAINLTNYLKKKLPNIKLHVFGEMDLLTKEYITTLDLSNTIFHGKIDSGKLPLFYRSIDIGLSPSIFDPCPNSVVEMMGCGLPVLSNLESGASELIGIKDLLIPEGLQLDYYELQTYRSLPKIDVELWAERVCKILDNKKYYTDQILYRVKKYLDIKIIAKKYAEFIEESYYAG